MKRNTPLIIALGTLVLAVIVVSLLVVRGSSTTMDMSSSTTQASEAEAVATNSVTVQSYAFSPAVIKVKVGTSVTWTNKDAAQHTVTADKASSDAPSSKLFGQNESYTFTFKKAGTYAYHCTPHSGMHGTVIVE